MTLDEAGVVLDALTAAFPVTMSEDTAQIYARFLVDLDFETGIAAVARYIARGVKFPRIAELREACEREGGSAPPDADRAFAEVIGKAATVGAHRPAPTWSHVAIGQAVEAVGGWVSICTSKTDDHPALRAHFAKAYVAAQRRTADPAHHVLVASLTAEVRARVGEGHRAPQIRGDRVADSLAYARKALPEGKR